MSGPGWELDDGEALAAGFPATFLIAPRATRAGLRPGDYAKLIFRFASVAAAGGFATERMWLIVVANDAGRYRGRLVNQPHALPDDPALHYLGEIAFDARHVVNWEDADDRSLAFLADPSREF